MKRQFVLFTLIIFAIAQTTFAAFSFENADFSARVTQTGTLYIQDPVATASIIIAIPQNTPTQTVQQYTVKPENIMIEPITDEYGNTLLRLQWSDLEEGMYYYTIETVINSSQRFLPDIAIGINNKWLAGEIPDNLRKTAWYYREAANMSDVAEIIKIANSLIVYDNDSRQRTAEEILEKGSGDAISYSIISSALLRAAGIPARIAIGDARMPETKQFSNHAWVEVLAYENGKDLWVPFDATLIRGGSITTDYITMWTGSSFPQERLEFIGAGNAAWKKNDEKIEVFSKNTALPMELKPIQPAVTFPKQLYGWITTTIEPKGCGFWKINPLSCVDSNNDPLFTFTDANRYFWACDKTNIIWLFKIKDANYICPTQFIGENGARANVDITVDGEIQERNLSIEGLESIAIGKEFDLIATGIDPARESDMIFYSPALSPTPSIQSERIWTLNPGKPGIYDFYLWFDGSFAKKTVRITEQQILSAALSSPNSAAIDVQIPITVAVSNHIKKFTNATLELMVDNIPASFCWQETNTETSIVSCSNEKIIALNPGETSSFDIATSIAKSGTKTLTASIKDTSTSSVAFVSKQIEIITPPQRQLETITKLFSSLVTDILQAFAIIPRMTLGMR